MIDLHTHILPDWDDGARDWDEALRMCEIAAADGIKKIVLTPHIYRMSRHNDDLAVLDERMAQFRERTAQFLIAFYRGAEVFVHHDMDKNIPAQRFGINDSSYVFIEFASDQIPHGVRDLIYKIMMKRHVPVISHPERNHVFAEHPGVLYDLVCMGCLAQVTAMSLCGGFGRHIRQRAALFMKHNLVHIIASDAHNAETRPPILSRAVKEAKKIVGAEKAEAMVTLVPQAILDNKVIPDLGEPENPERRKIWTIRLPFGKKGT